MLAMSIGLVVLLLFTGIWILVAYAHPGSGPTRGMGLPRGSIRALIAVWVIGSFIIFVFFGRDALGEAEGAADTADALYEKVLLSFTTLVGAISGFYFGGRAGQKLDDPAPDTNGESD